MTKKISGKYWITSISATVIITGIVLACAGDWGPEYGTSSFTPEVIVRDSTYSPFFYSNEYYYGIGHDDNHDHRFNETNLHEWSAWLGKDFPVKDVRFLLEKAPQATLDSAVNWATSAAAPTPAALRGRLYTDQRGNGKLRDFVAYLQLARTAEGFALNNASGSWDYERTKKKTVTTDAMPFDQRLFRRVNMADTFLQKRYWFQRVRNFFFNGAPRQAIDLFTQQEKQFTHDEIYYRTMAYAAGAWYKLKRFSQANYYYSLVYAACPALRTVAHYSFHPQEQTDWQATLALCTNTGEKATCWQMLGIFYGDESRSIEEIYKLDPRSTQLDLLLVRAVNIAEQGRDSAHLPLLKLVTRIAKEGKTARPWVWNMAAGYLQSMGRHYTEAIAWYDRTAATIPHDDQAQSQLRLLRLVNSLDMTTRLDARTENKLLPELVWLTSLTKNDRDASAYRSSDAGTFRSADAFQAMRNKLSQLYLKQNDPVRAECFITSTHFYADDKRVLALQDFLNRAGKTPYEQFLARLSHIQASDLYQYQAIKSAYAGNLEDAIAKLTLDTAGFNTVLPGNPFNARIQDCHDCDFEAPQKIKYTKGSFLKKLKEMKDKIAANQEVYTNAVLLGNAYYNMSHFGNARAFYEGAVIGAGASQPDYIDSIFRKMLTSMSTSTRYYQQALKAATNDEQRAKCQYLLAKCERNDWYMQTAANSYGYDHKGPDFLEWKGFAALRQYSSTQYYKEVLRECGYFNTYAKKHPTLYRP